MRLLIFGGLIAALAAISAAHAAAITVVAAENFYGDVARQIGGPEVTVGSILSNPDQDPHLFEVSPSVGRAVSRASVVIYSGIGYDSWMAKLLRVTGSANRTIIVVAELAGRKTGDNPHIWYDPQTMPALARRLAGVFAGLDPAHRGGYERRLAQFEASVKPIREKIAALRRRYAGVPVTATEPLLGYMFDALGMQVRNQRFQLAVMNGTEPSPSDVAAFENDLKGRKVRLLVYNSQSTDPIADRMKRIAGQAGVPVVGATETEPAGSDYQAWMIRQLDAVDRALAEPAR